LCWRNNQSNFLTQGINFSTAVSPDFEITGSTLVCDGNETFNLLNIPSNLVTWSAIPAELFQTSSGSGTVAYLEVVPDSGGSALIKFNVNGACGSFSRELGFSVGIPGPPPMTPDGNLNMEPNNTIQINAIDLGELTWTIEGNSAHYNYSITSGNTRCVFTPTAPGNFKIKAQANFGCGLSDFSILDISCQYNRPDLTIENLTVTTNLNSISFNYDLVNLGNVIATAPVVNYYWSENTTYEQNQDIFLGTNTTSNIPPNGRVAVSRTIRSTGSSYSIVLIYADPNNAILELNENNNLFYRFGAIPMRTAQPKNFTAYPSPFNNSITINFSNDESGETIDSSEDKSVKQVLLIDYLDATTKFNQTTSESSITIDTRAVPPGKYILYTKTSKGIEYYLTIKE
jgi:hypothetical protein